MCGFRVGDQVVCVDVRPPTDGGPVSPLVLNAAYTIKDVSDFADPYGEWGVSLVELPDPEDHLGFFAASRFRKIQRRDLTAWLATETTIEEPRRAPAKKRERA